MRAPLMTAVVAITCTGAAVIGVAQQTAGTAVLTGTVVTDSPSPQPVRHATVRLAGPAGMSARLVGTDDEGKFEFAALPAASYSVSASKIGSVTTFYGSKRPGRGPGVPVALLDGERASIVLKLLPGAVITGTIADHHGRPAAGVPVLAVDTRADAAAPARALTDDRGVYRIYGLAPGDYVVSAIPRPGTTSASVGVSAALAVTDAQARWAQSPAGAAPPAGRPMEYTPIYFPGVTNARAATRVAVTAGEEHGNIGFALQIVPTATIAGTLIDHTGQPLTAATVTLYPRKTDQPDASDAVFTSGAITLPRATVAAPKFSIAGVAPGEYTLVARSGSGTRSTAAALSAAPPLWNLTDVTVNGEDQTDLVLRLQPGVEDYGLDRVRADRAHAAGGPGRARHHSRRARIAGRRARGTAGHRDKARVLSIPERDAGHLRAHGDAAGRRLDAQVRDGERTGPCGRTARPEDWRGSLGRDIDVHRSSDGIQRPAHRSERAARLEVTRSSCSPWTDRCGGRTPAAFARSRRPPTAVSASPVCLRATTPSRPPKTSSPPTWPIPRSCRRCSRRP